MTGFRKLICVALSVLLLIGTVHAQEPGKQQLVGTWRLSSIINVRSDGTKYELFGPNANGMLMLDPNGFYSLQIMRSDWLPFARARMEGSAEENKAIVQSMISHFGTYTVDGEQRMINFHVISSSYPNWEKSEQKRTYVLLADDLSWTDPVPASGPDSTDLRSDLVWHRVRSTLQ